MLAEGQRQREIKPIDPKFLVGDLIQSGHPLFGLLWINPERVSGAPCFFATRVPVKNLFDYLEGGEPLSEFLEDFPGVTAEQAEEVISLAAHGLLEQLPQA